MLIYKRNRKPKGLTPRELYDREAWRWAVFWKFRIAGKLSDVGRLAHYRREMRTPKVGAQLTPGANHQKWLTLFTAPIKDQEHLMSPEECEIFASLPDPRKSISRTLVPIGYRVHGYKKLPPDLYRDCPSTSGGGCSRRTVRKSAD